jgi:hypothetical protein
LGSSTQPDYWGEVADKIKGRRKVSVAVEIADLLRTKARGVPPAIEGILQAAHKLAT